jgi:carboxyl-terminal processing protease
VIRAGFFFLLLLAFTQGRAEEPQSAAGRGPGFDVALARDVYGTALAFMAPRTLDPVSPGQLALWGLRGITAIDPAMTTGIQETTLVLAMGERTLFARPTPAAQDSASWGEAAAQLSATAWATSAAVRQAGTEGVVRSFFDELFNHLDPYSRYVGPEQAERDREQRSGVSGAGLVIAPADGAIVVQEAVTDGPAARAGIQPGDRVIAVNGQPTFARSAVTVAGWIAGAAESNLSITWRDRAGRTHTATLIRALVPPETVYEKRIGRLLVLRVTRFDASTAAHLAALVRDALRNPARLPAGLVLDLRGNRGGLVRQAVEAAAIFLDEGVVATTAGRDPQAARVWRSDAGAHADDVPIIVLVDGGTASAAEILAAALSDRGRAVVVGSSTLGKGLVQAITPLPNGGELFVTWSRILAPLGWPLQSLGVLPQVCTSLGREMTDRQLALLNAGADPMRAALERHRGARAPLPLAEILTIRSACPAAEGEDGDMTAARFLVEHPAAYATALLPPAPPARPGAGNP